MTSSVKVEIKCKVNKYSEVKVFAALSLPTSGTQLLNSMKVTVNWLTNECVEALWLVVPVDSQEVDGDTGQHDGQADATHHGLRVQGEDEQEGPEDEVNHGPDKANLKYET